MKNLLYLFSGIVVIWILLGVYVQQEGKEIHTTIGGKDNKKALVLFDPDPIYNMDQQICDIVGSRLSNHGYKTLIASPKGLRSEDIDYDLYVLCANTYNFAPDHAIADFVKNNNIHGKPIINIVLGAGTTSRAERVLDELVNAEGGEILGSNAYWLMRPNDEDRIEENNVEVALDMAEKWIDSLMKKI